MTTFHPPIKKRLQAALTAILLLAALSACAWAHASKAWQARLDARTAKLWFEGQDLDGIILNARGELNVTWLERRLVDFLDRDRDVHEWVVSNLGYYSSNRKENRDKLKGRDLYVLNYRAVKNWNFDPTLLRIGDYAVTADDILTKWDYQEVGELPPGLTGILAIAGPSLKRGQKIEIRYADAAASLEVPKN